MSSPLKDQIAKRLPWTSSFPEWVLPEWVLPEWVLPEWVPATQTGRVPATQTARPPKLGRSHCATLCVLPG